MMSFSSVMIRYILSLTDTGGHRGCDRKVVTTTCAISAYRTLFMTRCTQIQQSLSGGFLRFPPPIQLTTMI
jgi:hypothetical protein